ncbi:MAG: hypothetical protein ACI9JP_003046 [Granulosicoccus sp.]|jgi:hypothetical protein
MLRTGGTIRLHLRLFRGSPSKARGGRIGYSTDEQRSWVRCIDDWKCDFILSPALRHCFLIFISILLPFVSAVSHAQEPVPTDEWLIDDAERKKIEAAESIGIVRKATGYVDSAQKQASDGFNNFMVQVDGFFGATDVNDNQIDNKSWARLRLDARQPAGEKFDFKPSLKLRAVLPQTERRFKLLFSTEEDDTGIVGESVGGSSSVGSDSDQNASLAIRFIRSARSKANVNVDLGVRQRDSDIQYFTRLNTGVREDIGDYWTAALSNSYFYYNKSGFEDKLSLTFTRARFIKKGVTFRSFTEINWRKKRKGSIIGQTLGFYTQFGERKSLAFEILAGYHTALTDGVEHRFRGHEFRFRWRHNIWRPWFFYEFWPAISWPATSDYDRSYGVLLRVEMVIGQR